jgi:dTDP-4-amino-4,6-dideoxygalactose transaminase
MAKGIYVVTEMFERGVCEYTGAPFAAAIDNCSNAICMALTYEKVNGMEITIPNRTYMSVPCEIIHAGAMVKWEMVDGDTFRGPFQLKPTKVWDSSLRFTSGMYMPGTHMCLSFAPGKHLQLGKGGMILTDDEAAYKWFKRARMSGRNEMNYDTDYFDMIGWNWYMPPATAALGLQLMPRMKKHNDDLEFPYPDLSRFPAYKQ